MATRNASSATFTDVDAAVNGGTDSHGVVFPGAAATGDTVTIPANRPTSGTWALGGATGLAWNISAIALQTALIAAGVTGITVTGNSIDGYLVTWTALGVQPLLSGSAAGISNGLTPNGLDVVVSHVIDGTATKSEVQGVGIASNWPNALVMSNGITLQGQTTNFKTAWTLASGTTALLESFTGSQSLPVVSTTGFNASGGILDVCSATAQGSLSYTGISGNTFLNCNNIFGTGALDAFSFVGQSVCSDNTIISGSSNSSGILKLANATGTCRVTGLTIHRGADSTNANGWIRFSGTTSYRFDHCHVGSRTLCLFSVHFAPDSDQSAGVVDHCIIDNVGPSIGTADQMQNFLGGIGDGDISWSKSSAMPGFQDDSPYGRGGWHTNFYEDNYVYTNGRRSSWDGTPGARYVVRNNVIWDFADVRHGTEGVSRGARWGEHYNNIIVDINSATSVGSRAGSFLFANNTYYGFVVPPSLGIAAYRCDGAPFTGSGRFGAAYGWNPFDFNDISNAVYTNVKIPDGTTISPSATLGTGSAIYNYSPVNGFYVKGTATTPGSTTPTLTPTLSDTNTHTPAWQANQWANFAITRVKNATQPAGVAIGGSSVDLATLTGTQTVALAAGSGAKLYTSKGTGFSTGFCLGCIVIPGSPDKYILFNRIQGDNIVGCYSPNTGTITASTAVETGDMWYGRIDSNTTTTITAHADGSNEGKSIFWASGDKYVIARVISAIDASTRGQSEVMGLFGSLNIPINVTRGNDKSIYPRNKLEPLYAFNNLRPKTGVYQRCNGGGSQNWLKLEDRDYFNDNRAHVPWTASTPYSTGVASGLNANKPVSGMTHPGADITGFESNPPWVGYWATDAANPQDNSPGTENKGVLYVLTATNTWTAWWAPYTYPHPLTGNTVVVVKPVINSALTASSTVGVIFSYTITATNSPTSFNATGMPSGFTVNTSTGAIACTAVNNIGQPGTYNVAISATNTGGSDIQTLVLTLSGTTVLQKGKGRAHRIGSMARRM